MARAHINPSILKWAARRAGVTAPQLGKAFRKPPETIPGVVRGLVRSDVQASAASRPTPESSFRLPVPREAPR